MLGANTNVWDTDFHYLQKDKRQKQKSIQDVPSAPIRIEDDVWVGANSTILKGVTIGEGSVIGAHSLVNKSIRANFLAGGVPCKEIKKIE